MDVLQSIDSRIRSLTMTYSSHIEMGLCCFIPGLVSTLFIVFFILHFDYLYGCFFNSVLKIIDEVLMILRTIPDGNSLVNSSNVSDNHAHEILRKLREMSSRAMAHFRHNIRPALLAKHK